MAIAVVLVLLVVGSLIFHFLSPWYFTPIASNWGMIDTTVDITFWVTGIVFIAVNLFLAYAVWRYRHREGQRAHYEPENSRLEWILTIVTTVGVVAMLAPGLFVWAKFVQAPRDAMIVEALGQQWHWSFRLPGRDGVLGKADNRLISPDNPFGLSPDDPRGADDILIANPELHLPVDRPVKFLLRSKDVLHNFTVPQFRAKMDLVPGMVTYMWLTPTRAGEFDLLCEELCGLAHHAMRGRVIVDTPEDYTAWLAQQSSYSQVEGTPAGDAVAGKTQYAVCASCHGFEAEGNQLLNAPKLAGQEDWYIIRQIENYQNGLRGTHEEDILGQQMVPMAMTLADAQAVRNVAAYIATLPDKPAPATITGNVENGRELWETCGACHGRQGQGIWSLNAPRQAGMNDWYIAQQLKNFKNGWRGAHRRDLYGQQMAMMANLMRSEQAINDLVAFINTLEPPETESRLARR